MKETLKLVRGFNKKITKNYSADDIYKINENVKNLETALNQEKIIEFLDKKTEIDLKSFKNTINNTFSAIVSKNIESIKTYLEYDSFDKA